MSVARFAMVSMVVLAGCDQAWIARQQFPDREIYAFKSQNFDEPLGYACTKGADSKQRALKANAMFEQAVQRFAAEQAAKINAGVEAGQGVTSLVRSIQSEGNSWAITTAGKIEEKTGCMPLSSLK